LPHTRCYSKSFAYINSFNLTCKVSSVIIPILQIAKQMHREVKQLAQGLTAKKSRARIQPCLPNGSVSQDQMEKSNAAGPTGNEPVAV
jgi:hypothetical protein